MVVLSFLVSAGFASIVSATLGGGTQTFQGDGDPNVAVGSDVADTMNGGGGGDFFRGRAGVDTLNGDDGDDLLVGDDPGDPASFDSVSGGLDNDEIAGGPGGDSLTGGSGNDTIGTLDLTQVGLPQVFELGNDSIFGGAGNDIIDADAGNDIIDAGDDLDLIDAGDGDDTIAPGNGADEVIGGSGADRVSYEGDTGPVQINLESQAVGGSGGDKLYSIERATGSSGDDTLTGDSSANLLDGSLGHDVISGGGGSDTLDGGDGDDTLRNLGPTDAGDTIQGGDGADTVEVRNGVSDTVDCGPGSDVVVADEADVVSNCETIQLPAGPDRTLTVNLTGSGEGTVTGAGVNCPPDCSAVHPDGTVVSLTASPRTGSTFTGWSGACSGSGACSVTLDGDRSVAAGFASSSPPGDTAPPETVIDDRPAKKVKTKRKKAKVKFAFSASEQSSFDCVLDGESLGACSSPMKIKVKKGKHVFTVAATDGAGNTDASPAKAKFKVVKKRKK